MVDPRCLGRFPSLHGVQRIAGPPDAGATADAGISADAGVRLDGAWDSPFGI